MTSQDVTRIVRENIDAFSAGDMRRFASTLTDDSVYDELATRRTAHGKDEITRTVFEWRQAFPDAKGTIEKVVASGNTAVAEIVWEGTHRGNLTGPMGTIPPSGKKATVRASQVLTLEQGKIKQTNHYFDMLTLLEQIGAVPARAS